MKNIKNPPIRTRRIIVLGFLLLSFFFFSYMGVLTVIRGSKDLADLNHVEGQITGTRFINHKQSKRFRTIYKKVLVLRVEGTTDEFGFIEGKDAYKKLVGLRETGKKAEIYYDGSGKRIEQDVTLHTFDLTVGNYQIVKIADIKRSERTGIFFFFTAAFIILIIGLSVVRK